VGGDYTTRSASARPAPGAAPAGQPVDMDTTSFTFPLGDGARRHFGEVRAIACSLGARSRYLFIGRVWINKLELVLASWSSTSHKVFKHEG
jgi:hypothetical protein